MAEDSEKALVLFVAAEPRRLSPTYLGQEFRDIINEVERKGPEGRIEFRTLWAARPIDVTRAMSDYEPVIVHFSGHGTPDGGFLLQAVDGTAKKIDRGAMGSMFDTYKKRVKVVVLNSCYSEVLAEEIAKSVDVVIGMREKIGINAAVCFSVGFYRGIAAKKSVHQCFRMAKTELDMERIPESHTPVLYRRPGVEAYRVFAVGAPDLDRGRIPSSPEVGVQDFPGLPATHADHGINITVGDNATGRRHSKLAELALGGIAGAAAERCLEVMIRSHGGADRQGESSADNSRSRDDAGIQRDDSGQLTALHGVPVRQYEEAEPSQLARELGKGRSVLIGTEPDEGWSQNAIFQDLGATDPILLSRIETSESGYARVVVLAPGSEKGAAGYSIGSFLEAWSGCRFFMVATQEQPRSAFQFPEEAGLRWTPDASFVDEAIWDGLQDVASDALEDGAWSHLAPHGVNTDEGQSLLDSSCPNHHEDASPSPLAEDSLELSMPTDYFADPIDTEADEDESFGDLSLGEDGWLGIG